MRVAKGRKAEIKAHAERQAKSINGYVTEAIDEKMERDQEWSLSLESFFNRMSQFATPSKKYVELEKPPS